MLQFPRFGFIPRRPQKTSQAGFIYRFRSALAFGLAALLFCAPLSFGVSARSLTAKRPIPVVRKSETAIKPEPAIVHNHPGGAEAHSNESKEFSHGYVIEMIGNTTACRNATKAELQLMRSADRSQRLYPVKRRVEQPREYDFQSHASKPSAQSSSTGLKINFRESEQLKNHPDRAKVIAGFQRAAAVWEGLIKNPISIIIDIDYGKTRFGEPFCDSTPCQTLGSTTDGSSPARTLSSVRNLLTASASSPAETTLYSALPQGTVVPTNIGPADLIVVSRALARALGFAGFGPNATDTSDPFDTAPSIGFNENFAFDFNPDDIGVNDSNNDGIENLKTDFDAVAVHEIGHALGFTSFVGFKELSPELPNYISVWDLFRVAPGVNMSTLSTANRWLSSGNTPSGNPVFFNNMGGGLQVSTGNVAGIGGDGEQSSHWKDDLDIGIMDPTISRGIRQTVQQNDLNALETFGYNLGNSNLPPPPPPPPPPANDNFANAQILSTCSGSVTGTNESATKEVSLSEPNDPSSPGSTKSVWYQLTATSTGSITIDTRGSNFDTTLAVYTGNSLGSLSPVQSNDDSEDASTPERDVSSFVTFQNVTPGTIYRISVNGYNNDGTGGDTGNIKLNWTQSSGCAPPPPPGYTISGRVANGSGNGIGQVTLTLSGSQSGTTQTDANGNYSINVNGGGHTVTPSKAGYSFVPTSLTVTNISSNQTFNFTAVVAPVNPIDGTDFFVRQHYLDFLDREPEADGFNYWTSILNGCGTDFNCLNSVRVEISSRFFIELEFQRTGFFVMRMHQASYGQPPTFAQFLADRRLVQNSAESQKLFASQWVQRSAFLTEYPNALTPTQFVTKFYNAARITDPAAQTAAVQALTNGTKTRADVVWELVERADYQAREYNPAFVRMMYFGYLRREVEASGFTYWMNVLTTLSPNNYRSMICGFVNAGEYQLRFNSTRGKFTELNCIW
jgi:hypothetical protein